MALDLQISQIENEAIRNFFKLAFSSIIITKSGGVSLALDLAHTRPHKAKIVFSKNGEILFGEELLAISKNEVNFSRLRILTKKLRSPIEEFEKRCIQNMEGLVKIDSGFIEPDIRFGNAQRLPSQDNSVDLIVTSPPYASKAIDYMPAHKFALVWLGHKIDDLGLKRREYIGGEGLANIELENLPGFTLAIIAGNSRLDPEHRTALHRCYSEMKRTLREMYRVVKPGKAAIVVVGNSLMRGKNTETQNGLADIGRSIGFKVPTIGLRKLDRNRRMLPTANESASAWELIRLMGCEPKYGSISGQTAGNLFELITKDFPEETFGLSQHIRPGKWIYSVNTAIWNFDQYKDLAEIERVVKKNRELATTLGQDYVISPDITIARAPLSDDEINAPQKLIEPSDTVAKLTPIRNNNVEISKPILHASISCNWTLRSDRAQNARTEALNLIRNRKGELPHIVAVTAEPTPVRIASLALGSGDIDCVYHFSLDELKIAIERIKNEDQLEMLNTLIEGRRLRDISDLLFDLAT